MAKKIVGKTDEVLEAEAKETKTTKKATATKTTEKETNASTEKVVKDDSTTIDDEVDNITSEIPDGEVVDKAPMVKIADKEITEEVILAVLKTKMDNNDITDEFVQKVCNVLQITRVKKSADTKKYASVFWGNGQFMGMRTDD